MIPNSSPLYPRAIQVLQDRFHCEIPSNVDEGNHEDETNLMEFPHSVGPTRRPSDVALQWILSLFSSAEVNELAQSYTKEEFELFTQCIIVVCGALPTYIAISKDIFRTVTTFGRSKDLLHFLLYHALPMLLFHPSAVNPRNILTENDDNATETTSIYFSIWHDTGRDSSEIYSSDVSLYQNVIANVVTLPSVLRSVNSSTLSDSSAPLPKWILSEYVYLTQLMAGSLPSVMSSDLEVQPTSSIILFRILLRQLLRRSQGYYVATSVCSFYSKNSWSDPLFFGQRLSGLLFESEKGRSLPCGIVPHPDDATLLSSGEAAVLYRSVLYYVLSTNRDIISPGDRNRILSDVCFDEENDDSRYLSVIVAICHPLMQCYAVELCHLLVMSSSSIDRSRNLDRRLVHFLALHLSMTVVPTEDGNDSSDDDDSLDAAVSNQTLDLEMPHASVESSIRSPPLLLYRRLCDIASTWAQLTFILQTENGLQHHVTSFLQSGLTILIRHQERIHKKPNGDTSDPPILFYSTLSMQLLEGITARLGSANSAIRRDGMEIGEQVATLLGQPSLKFEELHGEPTKEPMVPPVPTVSDDGRMLASLRDHDDEDSDWDEDSALTVRYDIEDDRLDLLTTPRPLYLSECLDYLRTPDTDENIASRHDTVLRYLPSLVRERPADLADCSAELARSVLRLENKFSIPEFSTLVAESLCSLVVEDPLTVGTNLIAELFEDGSLRDRLTILHALDQGAYELSGLNQPEKKSIQNGLGLPPLDVPRISGKREVLATAEDKLDTNAGRGSPEDRTRRWGKGRHPNVKQQKLENRFAQVFPEWFYLLLGRFVQCKENTTLWGGDVGATLLSSLILTLSRILSCTGPFTPGVDVLAKDLWELVWSFRLADVAQVRISVLYAVGAAIGFLREDTLMTLLLDSTNENLITNIQLMCENDPDQECRAVAKQLRYVVVASLKSMDHSHLMIKQH